MPRIVALTNGSPHSWIILNAVIERWGPITVLTEGKERRIPLIRRRMKRQGAVRVLGQIGFSLLQGLIQRRSRPRIEALVKDLRLERNPHPSCEVIPIGSVNGPLCREALKHADPELVIVFGTQIIRRETLACIQVPIINLHSGITPKYRGQAGGYWALASGDPEHAGVTVHLLDEGVDTGAVLRQGPFQATAEDNFSTYFYLQAAVLRTLTLEAVAAILAGDVRTVSPELPSQLFYTPTLWGYVWTGLTRRVW